ncbi:MAG TPA: circularly permuted type 2 ATP-grasp protein, partial [Chitinophagaceae bacterium]|nr:circularly permuted type 2 ATP-grasp protein [Chitinophagaceae bacterium]
MEDHSLLASYHEQPGVWDEMFAADGIRSAYGKFVAAIQDLSADEMTHKDELAKKLFMSQGITFTVYSSGEGIEKIFPFDIIPRILEAAEWKHIEEGIKQRLKALNIFLKDIYHQQFIIKDGIVPAKLIYSCPNYVRQMVNVSVPFDIYTHISGIDLIRDHDGTYYVLEDNLRTPSGVSYMLENRSITYRIFPDLLP